MNKNVCYTCISKPTDVLQEIKHKSDGWDYVCFSLIEGISSDTWIVHYVENVNKAFIKILPHLIFDTHETSIYIEPNLILNEDLNALCLSYCNECIGLFQHPIRNCLYAECIECLDASLDDHKKIERQIKKYANEGFPLNYGLYDPRFIYRKHNEEECIKLMKEWHTETFYHSNIDHISLPYVLWKTDFRNKISIIPPGLKIFDVT